MTYYCSVDCHQTGYPVLFLTPTSLQLETWQGNCADPGEAIREFRAAHPGHRWRHLEMHSLTSLVSLKVAEHAKLLHWNDWVEDAKR